MRPLDERRVLVEIRECRTVARLLRCHHRDEQFGRRHRVNQAIVSAVIRQVVVGAQIRQPQGPIVIEMVFTLLAAVFQRQRIDDRYQQPYGTCRIETRRWI